MAVNNDAESDSGDELPSGWEVRTSIDGRVYYANHELRSTQWEHPISGKRMRLVGDLPQGWDRIEDKDGTVVFVKQQAAAYDLYVFSEQMCEKTTVDPRLAFAVEDILIRTDPPRQKHDASTTATQVLHGVDLNGKTALITGANSGIGFETALALASAGAHVVLACRNLTSAQTARERILIKMPIASIDVLDIDLSSLLSVRRCAQTFLVHGWPLHMLILNAAVFGCAYEKSENGLEMNFAVNHLGHYYLTKLLSESKVHPVVASESHKQLLTPITRDTITVELLSPVRHDNYWYIQAYGVSKLCNVLFAFALNRRMISSKVSANCVHPGNMISTGLPRRSCLMRTLFTLVRPFTKSLPQGAATSVYAACAPELEGFGGQYLNNCWFCKPADESMDVDLQERLWQISETLIEQFERGQLGPNTFDFSAS